MTDTNCTKRFREFRRAQTRILEEDLEALQRLPDHERIERYNELKRQEETFDASFCADCPSFLTDTERKRVRGEFRLARLLLAASFYAEGDLPRALADEFSTAELDAVVEFDRYSVFDTLSEEQIERKIRRMDGEVYELVMEYTSTQLANIESLTEQSEVQQAVIDRLLTRYENRREKIRRGFFTYVETQGLEHMVAAIEDAVRAVADAADERSTVRAKLKTTVSRTTQSEDLHSTQRDVESELTALAGTAASGADADTVAPIADGVRDRVLELQEEYETVLENLNERLNQLEELETRIDSKVEELTQVRERVATADREAADHAAALVDAELEALHEEQTDLENQRFRLELGREQIEHAQQTLTARRQAIDADLDDADEEGPATRTSPGIDSSHAVSAQVARLMEMDYLGRFDISMSDVIKITTPDGSFTVPDGYWDDRSERRSERTRLKRLLNGDEEPSEYPLNQTARYEITNDRYFGLSRTPELIIEANVYTTLESHVRAGFDAQPANLGDLLRFVEEAVHEAEWRDCAYLLAVASPTGWSDEVYEYFTGENMARSRFSEAVSVILVDLRAGEAIYDDADIVAAENAHLFETVIDAERVSTAVETIRETYLDDVGLESVPVQMVTQDHGFDSHIVTQAFHQLADSNEADLLYLDELGLCLEGRN